MAKGKTEEKTDEKSGKGDGTGAVFDRSEPSGKDEGGGQQAPSRPGSDEGLDPMKDALSEARQSTLLLSRVAELEAQLARANEKLTAQETTQRAETALLRSGAIDLETTLLLVERELADAPDLDIDAAVASVRQRKPFLFGSAPAGDLGSGQSIAAAPVSEEERLVGLADAALQSGDRGDVLRFLRARRS